MKFDLKQKFPFRSDAINKLLRKSLSTKWPKEKTLDRLALVLGFLSWEDLQETLRGETDGQVNISNSPKHRQLKNGEDTP